MSRGDALSAGHAKGLLSRPFAGHLNSVPAKAAILNKEYRDSVGECKEYSRVGARKRA